MPLDSQTQEYLWSSGDFFTHSTPPKLSPSGVFAYGESLNVPQDLLNEVAEYVQAKFAEYLNGLDDEERNNPHMPHESLFDSKIGEIYRARLKQGIRPTDIVESARVTLDLSEEDANKMSDGIDSEEPQYPFNLLLSQDERTQFRTDITALERDINRAKESLERIRDNVDEDAITYRDTLQSKLLKLEGKLERLIASQSNIQPEYIINTVSQLIEGGVGIEVSPEPIPGRINIACRVNNSDKQRIISTAVYIGKLDGVNIGMYSQGKGNIHLMALDGYSSTDGADKIQKLCYEILQKNTSSTLVYISRT